MPEPGFEFRALSSHKEERKASQTRVNQSIEVWERRCYIQKKDTFLLSGLSKGMGQMILENDVESVGKKHKIHWVFINLT